MNNSIFAFFRPVVRRPLRFASRSNHSRLVTRNAILRFPLLSCKSFGWLLEVVRSNKEHWFASCWHSTSLVWCSVVDCWDLFDRGRWLLPVQFDFFKLGIENLALICIVFLVGTMKLSVEKNVGFFLWRRFRRVDNDFSVFALSLVLFACCCFRDRIFFHSTIIFCSHEDTLLGACCTLTHEFT